MFDICCVGHITLDKIIKGDSVMHMAGGTSFYFSNAISRMELRYLLVTILAQEEMHYVNDLRAKGVEVRVVANSKHSVYFENNYTELDYRTQRVLQQSDAFGQEHLVAVEARIFHLGPLLANDIPQEIIKTLSEKGKVSLDVQGYLRTVVNKKVHPVDWSLKKETLRYVDILKANEMEMEVLTGIPDIRKSALVLSDWGVKEILITLGNRGSVIYNGVDFFDIPAYTPNVSLIDTTGCGDTYMAGYLYQRALGRGFQQSGEFAAAMATLKIESSGPFTGTAKDVEELLVNSGARTFFAL
jgi:sugar/nucleoside kinase (ribokinase family)